jgi:hypothetical protein
MRIYFWERLGLLAYERYMNADSFTEVEKIEIDMSGFMWIYIALFSFWIRGIKVKR